jgi:hypothetical protein
MKLVTRIVFAVSFMFASVANANVILSLDPVDQEANIGEMVAVNVMISGLGDGVPLSLATFDIDVAFDTSALSFAGYNLGSELGADFFASDDFSLGTDGFGGPSAVNIAEFSYLSNEDLWDFQPGSFALAELFFTVIAEAGTSALAFSFADLTDVNGDTVNIIGVNDASVTVSTPATLSLMGLALLGMFTRQKRILSVIKKS